MEERGIFYKVLSYILSYNLKQIIKIENLISLPIICIKNFLLF
jgi:hypothetical protein